MSLHAIANHMAAQGRDGDKVLVHMTPRELHGLQSLAVAHGGTLTINPETGLPEAGFLDKILPVVAGAAITYFSGGMAGGAGILGAGTALGASGATAAAIDAGIIVGGAYGAYTGDIGKGLSAGLAAYGGAGLGQSLAASGVSNAAQEELARQTTFAGPQPEAASSALTNSAAGTAPIVTPNAATPGLNVYDTVSNAAPGEVYNAVGSQEGIAGLTQGAPVSSTPWPTYDAIPKVSDAMQAASDAAKNAPFMDKMSAGFNAVKADPMGFAKANSKYLMAAASPFLMGDEKKMPTSDPAATGYIRPKVFNPYTGTYSSYAPVLASDWGSRNMADYTSGRNMRGIAGLAHGGAVAFAEGGVMTPDEVAAYRDEILSAQGLSNDGTGNYYSQDYYDARPAALAANNANTAATDASGVFGGVQDMAAQNMAQPTKAFAQDTQPVEQSAPATVDRNAILTAQGLLNDGTGNYYSSDYYAQRDANLAQSLANRRATDASGVFGGVQDMVAQDAIRGAAGKAPGTAQATPGTGQTPVTPVAEPPSYTPPVQNPYNFRDVKTPAEHNAEYSHLTNDSAAAYKYLMGDANYPVATTKAEFMKPYWAAMGVPTRTRVDPVTGTSREAVPPAIIFDPATQKYIANPEYTSYVQNNTDAAGVGASKSTLDSINSAVQQFDWSDASKPNTAPSFAALMSKNGWTVAQVAKATGFSVADIQAMLSKYGSTPPSEQGGDASGSAGNGGDASGSDGNGGGASGSDGGGPGMSAARGGIMHSYAQGGISSLGGYSDGGQLLRGPGDGISDNIPATIGGRQPARLADGEFVVPARIVSELGNGSTEAGARQLYKMMDRVQARRGKTVGKNNVAVDSKAHTALPA